VQHLRLIHHASTPQPLTASRSALSTAPSLQQPLGQLHSRTQHSARTAVSSLTDGIFIKMNLQFRSNRCSGPLIRFHPAHSTQLLSYLGLRGVLAVRCRPAVLSELVHPRCRSMADSNSLSASLRCGACCRTKNKPGGGGSTGRREPNGVDRRVPPVTKVSAVPVALCHAGPDCRCRVARVRHARVRRPVTRAGGRGPVSPP
jgi:hypothetical protein